MLVGPSSSQFCQAALLRRRARQELAQQPCPEQRGLSGEGGTRGGVTLSSRPSGLPAGSCVTTRAHTGAGQHGVFLPILAKAPPAGGGEWGRKEGLQRLLLPWGDQEQLWQGDPLPALPLVTRPLRKQAPLSRGSSQERRPSSL